MKKISIIIPVYNSEKYILRCLESVKDQTYKNFEIILINDVSKDNSLEILNVFRKENPELEIQIQTNKQNSGPSISRNNGIEIATGDYIFFIDADDDLTDNNVLQNFIDKTGDNPDIVFAENYFFVDDKLTESRYHTLKNKKDAYVGNEILDGFFLVEWASVVWNKLYDINFIKKNNLRFPEGLLHEDELWVFQISALAKKINFLNKKTYNYYFSNQGSITGNVGIKNMNDYKAILKEKLKFAKAQNLYESNAGTEKYIRNFAKQILLAKVVLLGNLTFTKFYLELKDDFKEYFPDKNEFDLNPTVAFYLYKTKFDKEFVLYGKFPKYVNPLLKI